MKRWAAITLGFLTLTSASAGSSTNPALVGVDRFRHDRWTSDDGAPAYVNAIAQTPDGFLWLAGDGLTRFDGRTFERIAAPAGALATASVASLLVDRRGRLWVGYGQGAGVAIYAEGRLQPVPMPTPPPQVTSLFQTADGAIWARWGGLGKRLFRWQGGRWRTMDNLMALPPGTIGTVATTRDGVTWMTIAKLGGAYSLLRLPRGGGRIELQPDQIGGPTLAVAPDGGLWTADPSGTREIRRADGLTSKALARYSGVPGAQIRRLAFDPSGGVWGATRGKGIFRASGPGKEVARLGLADGLTSDMAVTAFADREGNVWIGTDGGFDRYRLVAVSHVRDIPPDLISGLDLAADHDGSVYIVSRGALYVSRQDEPPQKLAAGLKDMSALCPAAQGGIWIVQAGRISKVEGRTITRTIPPPPGGAISNNCAEDAQGRLWIDVGEILWWHDMRGWHRAAAPLAGLAVWHMIVDLAGNVVLATADDRSFRIEGDHVQRLAAAKIGVGNYSGIAATPDGVWFGGPGGLALLTPSGSVRRLDVRRYPWAAQPQGIAGAPDGSLWLFGAKGLIRIERGDIQRALAVPGSPVTYRVFDERDGLAGKAQHVGFGGAQLAAEKDGRIWAATATGFFTVGPDLGKRNLLPPPVVITNVAAGDRGWRDPSVPLTLPAGAKSVRFSFAANSLGVPKRVRVLYRLEGQDTGFTDAGARREADYTNLSPGNYVFRVIAANDDGVWNKQGASLTIVMPPTFVQSWPFRILCIALLVGLGWLAYAVRLRIVARQIRARLLDRLRERERIARDIHDTLLQSIQALMLRFQLALDSLPAGDLARRDLEEALDRADEVVADGRGRLLDLRRTDGLDDAEEALQDIASRQLAGSKIDLLVTSIGVSRPINPLVWNEMASIAAEVFFNVARHSRASKAVAELRYHPGDLTLVICDDGIGVDPAVARDGRRGHFGIPGMRERAARVGAGFAIVPRREGGTEVTIMAPAAIVYTYMETK